MAVYIDNINEFKDRPKVTVGKLQKNNKKGEE